MKGLDLVLRAFNAWLPDEDAARAWFEAARWPHGPECPKCGSLNRSAWIRTPRRWNCLDCRHQFSVTAGTPMHRTHLPLLTWAGAIYLIVASSKGISAVKLGEMLGISYPAAWHLGHRIRAMLAEASPVLAGVVEIDRMYAGAPSRKRLTPTRDHNDKPPANLRTRGTKRPPVMVAAERGSEVDARVIPTHGKAATTKVLDGSLASDAM